MRDYIGDGSFAVMILSYGHPEKNLSYDILQKLGYTGKIFFITSDDDKSVPQFRELYGDRVKTFHKEDIQQHFDIMDNRNNNKCAVFARNYCFDVAKEENLDFFMELDDDSTDFFVRWKDGKSLKRTSVKTGLDEVFNAYISFLDCSPSIRAVAMPQGGDYIGGLGSMYFKDGFVRKCMNTWFCKTADRFWFEGRMNDDVNTFTRNGQLGGVYITAGNVVLDQLPTQLPTTGMGDMYKNAGTYQKSFYTVMLCPSCAKIKMMGDTHKRVHHTIEKNYDFPKIISDKYKK